MFQNCRDSIQALYHVDFVSGPGVDGHAIKRQVRTREEGGGYNRYFRTVSMKVS